MKYLKFLMVAGLVMLVSAGAGATVDENGLLEEPVMPESGSQVEEEVAVPPLQESQTPSDATSEDSQLPESPQEVQIEPWWITPEQEKINEKITEIENKIKEFYGVDDLSQLGKLGEHLKKMLEEARRTGLPAIDNLELKEIYKDGKYVLELTWDEKFARNCLPVGCDSTKMTIHHTLRFEGKIDNEGNIAPTKISWEKAYDDGRIGVTFPKESHTFTFDSEGIVSETIEYTEPRPIYPFYAVPVGSNK